MKELKYERENNFFSVRQNISMHSPYDQIIPIMRVDIIQKKIGNREK